jgi:DNA polymerase sigma
MVIASIQHHAKVRQHGRWQQLDALENNIKRNTANSVSKKKLKKNIIEQKKNLRKKITANGPIDLGTMLLEFLEFYGRALDINVVGISVRGQGTLYRKNTKSFYNPNRKLGEKCVVLFVVHCMSRTGSYIFAFVLIVVQRSTFIEFRKSRRS